MISSVAYRDRQASALCIMELVQGCRNRHELRAVKEFFRENIATTIYPNQNISERALALFEKHSGADGLRTVDALVAATALHGEQVLVTANHKHFTKFAALEVRKFIP